jgi:poly-gamma-glutamate synthase PgsB/CapB
VIRKLGFVTPLQERLLAEELARAWTWLGSGGRALLLRRAGERVGEIQRAKRRLARLVSEVGTDAGAEFRAKIVGYLRDEPLWQASLAVDVRAVETSDGRLLDLAALDERLARRLYPFELEAEACLLVARDDVEVGFSDSEIDAVLACAGVEGRWSRRAAALGLVAAAGRRLEPDQTARTSALLEQLTQPGAQRWVQVGALDALAQLAPARALELVARRLEQPTAEADDLLVRARLAELCLKHRKRGWQSVLSVAHRDPSELVRQSAVRAELKRQVLEVRATEDASHRVRAQACLQLRRRFARVCAPLLARVARQDPHPFVVRVAAEELAELARGRSEANLLQVVVDTLLVVQARRELPPDLRSSCSELLLEAQLLTNENHRRSLQRLGEIVRSAPIGGRVEVDDAELAGLPEQLLLRALAVLSRDDFGVGVSRRNRRLVIHRGERTCFSWWRLLFELIHPSPSKRQAFRHSTSRRASGELQAPPRGLAEVTSTQVPGERLLLPALGEWGRHLPRVEDLLAAPLLGRSVRRFASAAGITTLRTSSSVWSRARGWLRLVLGHAELSRLRERSLCSDEPLAQRAFVDEVQRRAGISLVVEPYAASAAERAPRSANSSSGAAAVLALMGAPPDASSLTTTLTTTWHELTGYAASGGANRLSHLAVFSVVMLGAMLLRSAKLRRDVEHDRSRLPLVVGGWGTRGKSGTERLKAAFFQGMGYECLVKTTGCEAMFIHCIPGVPAREIFIYRPYDKATVWEQREVLSLAARLGVKVFAWECMALQRELVDLLQSQWMRDDYSTITNAYPDHEDVQGPTGLDVATAISEFVPTQGRLFTSEDQMLPLLRERARQRGSRLTWVQSRDAELISSELLGRFGHAEHPRNVALVLRLARSLGASATVALAEMADHVVPDLGVLKRYGPISWSSRELTFTNGMGANDRAGTLGNWQRAGFAGYDPAREPGRLLVTVVNNRADRIARSEVFAKVLVEDLDAHRHVLIGTNVAGLLGMIERALEEFVARLSLTTELPAEPLERKRVMKGRVMRALRKLLLVDLSAEGALGEAGCALEPALLELTRELGREPLSASELSGAERVLEARLLGSLSRERATFLARSIVRRRAATTLLAAVESGRDAAELERELRDVYRQLFRRTLVPIHDHRQNGDQIIEHIAHSAPPGTQLSVIGIQNIKGTGLDFVYRWISIERVLHWLKAVRRADGTLDADALKQLVAHADYGTTDAALVVESLEQLRAVVSSEQGAAIAAATARIRATAAAKQGAGHAATTQLGLKLRKLVRSSVDFLDSVLRRREAEAILAELVSGRLSHGRAAREMRALVARGKARDA